MNTLHSIRHIKCDPLTLCEACWQKYKRDSKRTARLKEVEKETAQRIKLSIQPGTPEAWQAESEKTIRDMNKTLETFRLNIPFLIGLEYDEALIKAKQIRRIKEAFDELVDSTKDAWIYRGMKCPEGYCFNPDEEPK